MWRRELLRDAVRNSPHTGKERATWLALFILLHYDAGVMVKLLEVKPFQQTAGYCGPACLKMVFDYFDVHVSEGAIAKVGGAKRSTGMGLEGMRNAAMHFNFSFSSQDDASFSDIQVLLKKGIPPIVDWFSVDDGHYCVVVGLDAKMIHLQDPEFGKIHSLDRQTFFRCWFDFPKDFIGKPCDVFTRRLIVVKPKGKEGK